MKDKIEFEALIESNDMGGAYVTIPFDVEKEFGAKRVKVKALFENKVEYRGTLVRMGSPDHILGLRKDIREQIGKQPGDVVKVSLEKDTEPRVVVVPDDYQKILDSEPEVKIFFKQLSYTHKKEYVRWIEEAKRQETRERRMLKSIEMMKSGKKGI